MSSVHGPQGQQGPGGAGPAPAGGQPPGDLADLLLNLKKMLGEEKPEVASTGKPLDQLTKAELQHEYRIMLDKSLGLTPPGTSAPPPNDASGLQNPWLKPSALVFLLSIRMEIMKIMMDQKMQEGLRAPENLKMLLDLAFAKGDAIKEMGEKEAAMHFSRAASSFASATVSAVSAGVSFASPLIAKSRTNSQIKNQSAKVENNPNFTKAGETAPAGSTPAQQNAHAMKQYQQARADYQTTKANPASTPKEVSAARQQMEALKPGTAQIAAYRNSPQGGAGGVGSKPPQGVSKANKAFYKHLDKTHTTQQKQLTKLNSPAHRTQTENSMQQNITNQVQMLSQSITGFANAASEAAQGAFTLEKAAVEALKVLIEAAEQFLRVEMDSQGNAVREANEAIADIVRIMSKEIESYSQVGRFGR